MFLRDNVWVVLAAAGIALIVPWNVGSGVDPSGVMLGLLTGGCWAAYIVLGGGVSRLIPGGAAVATGMTIATITVAPFALGGGGLAHFTPAMVAAGVTLAVLSSALPFTCEMHALRALPARTFSILMSLEPAAAALVGLLFLGEYLTVSQWLAVSLVVAASVGATVTTPRVAVHAEV